MRSPAFLLVPALLAAGLAASAAAHGIAKPKHGGLVDEGGETTFELVRKGNSVTIYVDDHGKPVDVRGASAELLRGSETGPRVALLKPVGANSLAGTAGAIGAGERIFVRLTLGNGSSEVGEFRVR